MRKPIAISPAKLEANRRNARKSTGPKTENGKAVSKLNALKHGLLAQTVVVRGHKLKESTNEFKKLCQEFYTSLAPIGPLEEMLVGQIVTATWRLRRARTAESGEIALSVDEGHWKRKHQHPALICMEWEVFGDPTHSMGGSALGSRVMENQLKEVRASVEKDGELTEAAIKSVVVQGKPYGLTKDLEKLRSRLQQNPERFEPAVLRAKQKEQALAYIDKELRLLSWRKSSCEEHEQKEEEAR